MKNTTYLSEIARWLPGTEFAWIGSGGGALEGLARLGRLDFSSDSAREVLEGFDFRITVGGADANPTTVLEAMAWALIPICTPQSGYVGLPGVVNVPLGDAEGAAAILRGLQAEPEADLRRRQRANWEALEDHYTWDRFASQVADGIDSGEAPPLGREGTLRRSRLAWAATWSYHTSPIRYWARQGRGRLRAALRGLRTAARRREDGRTSQ